MKRSVSLYIYYKNRLKAYLRRLWRFLSSIPTRITDWYYTTFVCYIALCADTEHFYISKRLYHRLQKADNRPPIDSFIFFERYPDPDGNYRYRFFINPDLSNIKTPDGESPYISPIQLSPLGHVGFQCVQPTPIEILTEYGIATPQFIERQFNAHVPLRIITYAVNGITCFEVTPRLAGRIAPPRRPYIPKSLRNSRLSQ